MDFFSSWSAKKCVFPLFYTIFLFFRLNNQPGVEGFISTPDSSCHVLVVKTNEEHQIAKHTRKLLGMEDFAGGDPLDKISYNEGFDLDSDEGENFHPL